MTLRGWWSAHPRSREAAEGLCFAPALEHKKLHVAKGPCSSQDEAACSGEVITMSFFLAVYMRLVPARGHLEAQAEQTMSTS